MEIRRLFGCWRHGRHLLGHLGLELLVFLVVHFEVVEHVVRVFVFPTLTRVLVGQGGGLALPVFFVSGIGQGRILHFGGIWVTAFDEMAGESADGTDRDRMFWTCDLAFNGDI